MSGPSRPFFDTTVLLAGLIDLGPATSAGQRIMDGVAERQIARPHTAWHCCLEFYSVATRLPVEVRLSPADALRLIEQEILGRFQVHDLQGRRRRPFLRAAAGEAVAGGRIYDAHIADIARHAGATVVVTDNRRHFFSLLAHGVRVLTTTEFAQEIRRA